MSDTTPASAVPLAYAPGERRRDSVYGIVGLGLAVVCAAMPTHMLWEVIALHRRRFPAYSHYVSTYGHIGFGANWPWFLLDTVAILLGVIAVYRGRPRFGVAASAVGVVNLVGVMTLVLGSPW